MGLGEYSVMCGVITIALYQLLILHHLDGRELYINPSEIVSLREGKSENAHHKHFTKGVHCMINTTDGKFFTVVEECSAIRKMIAEEIKRLQELERSREQ